MSIAAYFSHPDCRRCGCALDGHCLCIPSHPSVVSIPEATYTDLLAALQRAEFQLARLISKDNDRAAKPCLDEVRAAIAKAEGQS